MGATVIEHRRILERLEPAGTRRSAVELATLLNESPPRVRRALADLTRSGHVMALRTGGRIIFERRPLPSPRRARTGAPADPRAVAASTEVNDDAQDGRARDPRTHRRRVF